MTQPQNSVQLKMEFRTLLKALSAPPHSKNIAACLAEKRPSQALDLMFMAWVCSA
jgi:hypothetical protein